MSNDNKARVLKLVQSPEFPEPGNTDPHFASARCIEGACDSPDVRPVDRSDCIARSVIWKIKHGDTSSITEALLSIVAQSKWAKDAGYFYACHLNCPIVDVCGFSRLTASHCTICRPEIERAQASVAQQYASATRAIQRVNSATAAAAATATSVTQHSNVNFGVTVFSGDAVEYAHRLNSDGKSVEDIRETVFVLPNDKHDNESTLEDREEVDTETDFVAGYPVAVDNKKAGSGTSQVPRGIKRPRVSSSTIDVDRTTIVFYSIALSSAVECDGLLDSASHYATVLQRVAVEEKRISQQIVSFGQKVLRVAQSFKPVALQKCIAGDTAHRYRNSWLITPTPDEGNRFLVNIQNLSSFIVYSGVHRKFEQEQKILVDLDQKERRIRNWKVSPDDLLDRFFPRYFKNIHGSTEEGNISIRADANGWTKFILPVIKCAWVMTTGIEIPRTRFWGQLVASLGTGQLKYKKKRTTPNPSPQPSPPPPLSSSSSSFLTSTTSILLNPHPQVAEIVAEPPSVSNRLAFDAGIEKELLEALTSSCDGKEEEPEIEWDDEPSRVPVIPEQKNRKSATITVVIELPPPEKPLIFASDKRLAPKKTKKQYVKPTKEQLEERRIEMIRKVTVPFGTTPATIKKDPAPAQPPKQPVDDKKELYRMRSHHRSTMEVSPEAHYHKIRLDFDRAMKYHRAHMEKYFPSRRYSESGSRDLGSGNAVEVKTNVLHYFHSYFHRVVTECFRASVEEAEKNLEKFNTDIQRQRLLRMKEAAAQNKNIDDDENDDKTDEWVLLTPSSKRVPSPQEREKDEEIRLRKDIVRRKKLLGHFIDVVSPFIEMSIQGMGHSPCWRRTVQNRNQLRDENWLVACIFQAGSLLDSCARAHIRDLIPEYVPDFIWSDVEGLRSLFGTSDQASAVHSAPLRRSFSYLLFIGNAVCHLKLGDTKPWDEIFKKEKHLVEAKWNEFERESNIRNESESGKWVDSIVKVKKGLDAGYHTKELDAQAEHLKRTLNTFRQLYEIRPSDCTDNSFITEATELIMRCCGELSAEIRKTMLPIKSPFNELKLAKEIDLYELTSFRGKGKGTKTRLPNTGLIEFSPRTVFMLFVIKDQLKQLFQKWIDDLESPKKRHSSASSSSSSSSSSSVAQDKSDMIQILKLYLHCIRINWC